MAKTTAGSPSLKAENGKAVWLLVSADIVAIVLVLTGFAFTRASLSELAQSTFVRGLLFAAAICGCWPRLSCCVVGIAALRANDLFSV